MVNEVAVFNYECNEVRTVLIDDKLSFLGKDVVTVFEYKNTQNPLADYVRDKNKGLTKRDTLGGGQAW